jgi:cobalt/nickel transport system permease protein
MLLSPLSGLGAAVPTQPLLHIPDGFLNLAISLLCWLVTLVVLAVAVRNAQKVFDERLAPLAGMMAAFIFAGQMINFPIGGGTSGHLIGATLAFIVLGPWLGLLAMTAVIALQALLFQDGGLIVMGANILVMGIVPGMVGYGLDRLGRGLNGRPQRLITGTAAWLSVVIAALVTALLLAFSGTTTLALAVPAMLGVHALIGLGEALITLGALSFVRQVRPELLQSGKASGGVGWVAAGLALALAVVLLSPFASPSPDGLEWVAGQTGFLEAAQDAPYTLLPDYTIPFLGETGLSTIAAGILGTLLVAGLVVLVVKGLRQKSLTPGREGAETQRV